MRCRECVREGRGGVGRVKKDTQLDPGAETFSHDLISVKNILALGSHICFLNIAIFYIRCIYHQIGVYVSVTREGKSYRNYNHLQGRSFHSQACTA